MEDGYPVFLDECRLCNACVEACPEDAIAIKEIEKEADVSEYTGVLVYAEQRSGVVHPVAYELLGKGRELADQLGEDLYAVVIGKGIDKGAEELAV
ncbi:electron transfer flavoprotein subunit alpha, partial [Candidatus Bathyarchaeota archaeon]